MSAESAGRCPNTNTRLYKTPGFVKAAETQEQRLADLEAQLAQAMALIAALTPPGA